MQQELLYKILSDFGVLSHGEIAVPKEMRLELFTPNAVIKIYGNRPDLKVELHGDYILEINIEDGEIKRRVAHPTDHLTTISYGVRE